jgi:hypothetical protein
MSTVSNWRGPSIVKDGLVLYLDAGSPNSYYDKSSTTWKDISGGNNNGTLTNGPTYNADSGGNIVLDGTNDYVIGDGINLTTQGTLIVWFKTSVSQNNKYIIAMPWVSAGSNGFELSLTTTTFRGSVTTTTTGYVEINHIVSYNNNNWHMGSLTYNSTKSILYYDGVATSVGTNQVGTLSQTSNGEYNVGRFGSYGAYFTGNVGIAQVYDRALSATEILQNFNATKTRFGL